MKSQIVCIAGPNGAGKSTVAPVLLRESLHIGAFVNADVIAQGLSAFEPQKAAVSAGKIMLRRFAELVEAREDFAFETTLASRIFGPRLEAIQAIYELRLVFLWLPNVETAIARVASRVRDGGHDVPAHVIRRRYKRGIDNFFDIYQKLAARWEVYNSAAEAPSPVAWGNYQVVRAVGSASAWSQFQAGKSDGG